MKTYIVKIYGEKALEIASDEVMHTTRGTILFFREGYAVAEFASYAGYWEKPPSVWANLYVNMQPSFLLRNLVSRK